MISLLITSRIESNPNWGLPNLLQSLVDYSADHNNFEVLVKFDTCDPEVPAYLPQLEQYPFAVKHIVEPRGRGYIDIHIGYTRAMMLADDRSIVMGAFADDFVVIQPNWDTTVLAETTHFEDDIYMIHQRPHPCFYRPHFQDQPFYPHFNLDHVDELAIVDEGPFWSRKLLEICGGLGHVSFTDVWSLVIQWYLYQNHGLNRTRFLDQPQVYRVLHDEVDTREAKRWDTDRRINFDFIASDFYRTMVKNQARNVALNIMAMGGESPLLTPMPSSAELEQILMATAQGALEHGNPVDTIREYRDICRRYPHNAIARGRLAELLSEQPTEPDYKEPESTTQNTLARALEVASKF